ncbi:autotransporter-associated beta strand repeat-containing protein [Luteolibacter arcticus]|uniref:Autotransporter-associated beta strand repeat-containing protein n=1 Tax=Luteolibacter arcticus TaxID=1581411 RepID=A0ABT3GK62_9BACT|nr:autotransporter-associated beta strand repeat-containing protein [Luteolibacter arcticus]MCW1923910.1 autotransporter-associated beta strand repeat-containing protein [Luteolibacter arcticus]
MLGTAQAAPKTWTGTDGNMNTSGNWSGGTPVAGDQILFNGSPGSVTSNLTVGAIIPAANALGTASVTGIQLNAAQTSNVTIIGSGTAGNRFRFVNATATAIQMESGAGNLTFGDGTGGGSAFNLATNGSANLTFRNNSATSTGTFKSDVTFVPGGSGSNVQWIFDGIGKWQVDGAINQGAGPTAVTGVTKNGAGTLTLNGANTYTSATTINAGTLSAGNIVVSGGSSNLGNATSAVILGGAASQGTLSYTGNSATYTRGFTIGAGGGRLDTITSGQVLTVATSNITGTSGTFTIGGAGNTTVASAIQTGSGGLTKEDSGMATLGGNNTYSGATLVSAGTLLVSGALGNTAVTVGSTGTIGGDGTIAGTLHFDAGANFVFNPTQTLTVTGSSVTFGSFGVADLFGLDNSVAVGTYTLINGSATISISNLNNLGIGNAYNLGAGKAAYFEISSLNLVVMAIPEPGPAFLGSLGLLMLLRRRRG